MYKIIKKKTTSTVNKFKIVPSSDKRTGVLVSEVLTMKNKGYSMAKIIEKTGLSQKVIRDCQLMEYGNESEELILSCFGGKLADLITEVN